MCGDKNSWSVSTWDIMSTEWCVIALTAWKFIKKILISHEKEKHLLSSFMHLVWGSL